MFLLSEIYSSTISILKHVWKQIANYDKNLQPFTEYRLAIDDKISCSISTSDEEVVLAFNSVIRPNQSGVKAYIIYSDSTVILPFFGKVKIAGLTVQEAGVGS